MAPSTVTPETPLAHRILVVDDEEDLLELVRYTLTKQGHIVTCVGTGEEAVRQAGQQAPDAIVLDLMLPGTDSQHLARSR
jgi:two-component system phosphate regulon response regulator PhoB